MMLIRNDIYSDNTNSRKRVLQINSKQDEAWVYCVNEPRALPERTTYSELNTQLRLGVIVRVEGKAPQEQLIKSSKAKERRDKAWELIEPLVNNEGIYDEGVRSLLIQERAETTGVSKTTLYRYLRQYWSGGQTIDALIPRFAKCGRREGFKTGGRGKKPNQGRYKIYQIAYEDVEKIVASIKRDFLKGDVSTLPSAHLDMLRRDYSYVDGNDNRYIKPLGERPTIRQYRTVLLREFPLETILRKKKGDKEFERNHSPRLGSSILDCLGVGHIYEIDASIADIFLVARSSRARIIGKPTLYLIYDRWSRLVVGFYVGLEPPSWSAAMQAILTLAEDKAQLCKKYGINYSPHDWPAHGIFPQKFLGDRGEMLSKASDRICDGMASTISNTTALAPQRKGTVELGFRLIPRSMSASLPGYEPPENVTRRRGKHYEHDACLTLDEFIGMIIKAIIRHNRTLMRGYDLTPELIGREVRPIPLELWEDNVIHRAGYLTRYSEQYLRFELLPHGEAAVTDEGIIFSHCFYTSVEAMQYEWFVKAKNRGRFKVPISFNRGLVDEIYIHDSRQPQGFFVVKLTAKSLKYKGYSFAEVGEIEYRRKSLVYSGENEDVQERADLVDYVESVAKPAHREMKRETRGKARSARKSDTKTERNSERRERRQEQGSLMPQQYEETVETNEAEDMDEFSSLALGDTIPPIEEEGPRLLSTAEKLRSKAQALLKGNDDVQ